MTPVKGPKIRRPESHWPTPAELVDLIQAARGTAWEIPMLLAATTGARRSEVLGVAWQDVDLNAGTVSIVRGVQRAVDPRSSEDIVFTPLKTKRARRKVQLPAFALVRLKEHRRDQLERRSNQGAGWRDPVDEIGEPIAMVCERGDGFLIHPDSFTHAFKRLVRQAGLHPATRLHDVRHAVATELGRRGVHSVVVSAVLGHASPAFTLAVYQHVWREGPSEAADALEQAFRSARSEVGNPLAIEVDRASSSP